jgi:hypothetical protein
MVAILRSKVATFVCAKVIRSTALPHYHRSVSEMLKLLISLLKTLGSDEIAYFVLWILSASRW